MDSARLFNLLVLHGSLIAVTGCDPDDGEPPVGEESGMDASSGGEDDGASSTDSTPEDSSDTSDATSRDASTGSDDAETGGSSSAATEDSSGSPSEDSSGGPPLECSSPPSPEDTCGCPCCWGADPSCLNTDEVCCAGFTEACTPP